MSKAQNECQQMLKEAVENTAKEPWMHFCYEEHEIELEELDTTLEYWEVEKDEIELHIDGKYAYYSGSVLGAEFIIDLHGNLKGCEILTACGGPTIWLDTRKQEIHGAWFGCEKEIAPYPINQCDAVNDYWEEYLRCLITDF